MTQFELTTLIFSATETGNMALALYMTAISGYLVVAFTVGQKLSRRQVTLINTLFIFFSMAFSYSALACFSAMRIYTDQLLKISGNVPAVVGVMEVAYVLVVALGLIIGIIGAVVFMRNVRSQSAEN